MADESVVQAFAEAIAQAEGFFVPGSRPNRNNNPGDLTVDIGGQGIGFDGPFVIYRTATDGWADLYQQVRMALDNTSRIYNSGMSILDFAQQYTTTDQMTWAQTVANRLGVSLDTRLSDLTAAAFGGGMILFFIFALVWFGRKR